MTTLIVKVDDERAESLKRILDEIPYVHGIQINEDEGITLKEPSTQYLRIKHILDAAKGKGLFKDIKDLVVWQREIRKDWDRDI